MDSDIEKDWLDPIERATMTWIFKTLIKTYQCVISPYVGTCCRFEPTCSRYTLQAIEKHGSFKGLWLGIGRLLKCHPFHSGGLDPVP